MSVSLQATLMKPTGSHKNKKNRCQLKREGFSGMGKGKEKRKKKRVMGVRMMQMHYVYYVRTIMQATRCPGQPAGRFSSVLRREDGKNAGTLTS